MLTALLAIAGVAVAMGLIGLGVILKKRTPLKRSCHSVDPGTGSRDESCDQCVCNAKASEVVDEPR